MNALIHSNRLFDVTASCQKFGYRYLYLRLFQTGTEIYILKLNVYNLNAACIVYCKILIEVESIEIMILSKITNITNIALLHICNIRFQTVSIRHIGHIKI